MRDRPLLRVNPIACDGHGLCAELFPERVQLDDWGFPIVDPEPIPGSSSRTRGGPSRSARSSRSRSSFLTRRGRGERNRGYPSCRAGRWSQWCCAGSVAAPTASPATIARCGGPRACAGPAGLAASRRPRRPTARERIARPR